MGEMAEAAINGLLCEQCGVLIDGDEPGYARLCDDCEPKRKTKARGEALSNVTITLDGPHRKITTNRYLAMLADGDDCFIEVNGLDFEDILMFRMQLDHMIQENIDYLKGDDNGNLN